MIHGGVFFFFFFFLQRSFAGAVWGLDGAAGWSHWVFVGSLLWHRGNHFEVLLRRAWVIGFGPSRHWCIEAGGRHGRSYFSMNRPLTRIVALAFAADMCTHMFKETLFQMFSWRTKPSIFWMEVRPSPSVTVATRADFLNYFFLKPNHVFHSDPNQVGFVHKPNWSISTTLWWERIQPEVFNLSVVLQKHIQLTFILVTGLQGGCRVEVLDCWSQISWTYCLYFIK